MVFNALSNIIIFSDRQKNYVQRMWLHGVTMLGMLLNGLKMRGMLLNGLTMRNIVIVWTNNMDYITVWINNGEDCYCMK